MTDTKQKPPLICRMCKIGLVKYFCKACPPVSAADLPMTEDAQYSAASSGVDEKNQHGVAHNEGYQDEKMRENFSPSGAPAHVLNMDIRYDSEAAGIVSNIDPETKQRMAKLKQGIDEYKKKKEDNERAECLANRNCDGDKYETSENYTIHGQFTTGELAWRAHKRLFNWDMYVWRLPVSEWLPARDVQATREILENHFPLKTGDTGPAGGIIIKCDTGICGPGYHCVEAAPFDAGWATWQDALNLCEEISINGIGGWRLPTVEELRDFQAVMRKRLREQNVLQTTETVLNWSGARKGENALAVVTQENEDFWQYLYHYPMGGTSGGFFRSKDGPRRGDEKEFPITHRYPVRPVRDFYAKNIVKEK